MRKGFASSYTTEVFKMLNKFIQKLEKQLDGFNIDYGKTFNAESFLTMRIMKDELEGSPEKETTDKTADWIRDQLMKGTTQTAIKGGPMWGSDNTGNGLKLDSGFDGGFSGGYSSNSS